MKTLKMMQDFNCFCNLEVNHKLLPMFIIKLVYLCTLHIKIISPTHFVVYMLWRPMPTWFSNKNAEFFPWMNADFVMVRYLVSTLSTPVDKRVRPTALTSCQKWLHPVTFSDDISVPLGGRLTQDIDKTYTDSGENSGWTCFQFSFFQPAISP